MQCVEEAFFASFTFPTFIFTNQDFLSNAARGRSIHVQIRQYSKTKLNFTSEIGHKKCYKKGNQEAFNVGGAFRS